MLPEQAHSTSPRACSPTKPSNTMKTGRETTAPRTSFPRVGNATLDKHSQSETRVLNGSQSSVYDKWVQLGVQRKWSPHKGHRSCLNTPVPGSKARYVAIGEKKKVFGLIRCKSSTCRNCGELDAFSKAEELTIGSKQVLTEGGSLYAVALTTGNTGIAPSTQAEVIAQARKLFLARVRKLVLKLGGGSCGMAWSYDETFSIPKAKTHIHQHGIVGTELDVELDEDELFIIWRQSVSKVTGHAINILPVREAFYFRKVRNDDFSNALTNYTLKFSKSALETHARSSKSAASKNHNGQSTSKASLSLTDLLALLVDENNKHFNVAKMLYQEFVYSFQNKVYRTNGKFFKEAFKRAMEAREKEEELVTEMENEKDEPITEIEVRKEVNWALAYHNLQGTLLDLLVGVNNNDETAKVLFSQLVAANNKANTARHYSFSEAEKDIIPILYKYHSLRRMYVQQASSDSTRSTLGAFDKVQQGQA